MKLWHKLCLSVVLMSASGCATTEMVETRREERGSGQSIRGAAPDVKHEIIALGDGGPLITACLAYRLGSVPCHPAILMTGALERERVPAWSERLVNEGYMLVAFTVAHPPDPDPARRSQWLVFDERFAHSFALAVQRAPEDTERVVKYLAARGDVDPDKIGWMGSSSSGIPGLAVATRGPRLAAVVTFASTGAVEEWFAAWHTSGLWVGKSPDLWPETKELLQYDPIRHVDKLFPTAVLLVNGGHDKVVAAQTARAFVEAARPYYAAEPERLRLVVYEGLGHNLPLDVVKLHVEHWFHLYMPVKADDRFGMPEDPGGR